MPRRRRGSRGIAEVAERGLAMRILMHSPKDTVAGVLAFAAANAIIVNALFLQTGHHPAPMFGSALTMPLAAVAPSPLPRPRPVEAASKPAEASPVETKHAEPKGAEPRPAEPKAADPLTNLVVKATSAPLTVPSNVPRPPAAISSRAETIASSGPRRVMAVQRALTEYGYGQLKPTGTVGSDTQAAIQKFERERKMPVTGQVSDRLLRELTVVIGRPID